MTQKVNAQEFYAQIEQGKGVALVDMYADWCGPCKMLAPIIDGLSTEYAGKANFYKLDIDENQEVAAKYQVMAVPTMLIFKDGQLVDKLVGFMPKQSIAQRVDAQLS